MKRLIKFAVILIAVVLLALLGIYLVINAKDIPSYETVDFEYTASTDSLGLIRGKKLVSLLCANCHGDKDTGLLTGSPMLDAPPEFGKVYAPNITQDSEYGIGNYTDAELVYLLRTGIKKSGQYAPPYMVKLPHLADSDMDAIISFLRSDDPMVQAANVPDKPCEPSFLAKFLCRVAFKPYPMPEGPIAYPDTSDNLALGKYYAFNLECFSCHSASFETNDYLNPEKSEGFFGGGNKLRNLKGQEIYSSNITPHNKTGIGSWTREQFVNVVKYGSLEGEAPLQYPMVPYIELTDEEAGAMYDYIMTVPAIENEVVRNIYE